MDNCCSRFGINFPVVAGLRMVSVSVALMVVVLFYNKGLSGGKEFSWNRLLFFLDKKDKKEAGGAK
jgi:hypothetical protein